MSWNGFGAQGYQNLEYNSTLQTLGLIPYGNTITLNLAGGGSTTFADITTSNILNYNNIQTETLNAETTITGGTVDATTLLKGNSGQTNTLSTGTLFVAGKQFNPSPYSLVPVFATNFPGSPSPSGVIPAGGSSYQVTNSFSVNTSNYYRITIPALFQNGGDYNGYTTLFVDTSPVVFLITWFNQATEAGNGNASGSYSCIFKPNASVHKLMAINTSTTDGTGMTIPNGKIILENLGPIV